MNFFGYAPVENPLPGLNVLLTLVHLLGTIAFFVYAFVDSSCDEVTVYKTDQPLSTCAGMLATFTCRTSDYDAATSTGHEKTLNNKNCLAEQTEAVYGWHPRPEAHITGLSIFLPALKVLTCTFSPPSPPRL